MDRLTTRNSEGVVILKTPYRCDHCGEEIYRLADQGNGEPIERLAHYEELQEQGRLLEFPFNVGDWVWVVKSWGAIDYHKVATIEIDESGIWLKSSKLFGKLDDFGKTIFFDKQEAEEALRRMEDRRSK